MNTLNRSAQKKRRGKREVGTSVGKGQKKKSGRDGFFQKRKKGDCIGAKERGDKKNGVIELEALKRGGGEEGFERGGLHRSEQARVAGQSWGEGSRKEEKGPRVFTVTCAIQRKHNYKVGKGP